MKHLIEYLLLEYTSICICRQSKKGIVDTKGNYIKLAYCIGNFDKKLQNHLEIETIFKGTLSGIQNDNLIYNCSYALANKG